MPDEIEHIYPDYELYGITDYAYGFLTRGCPRGCDFCHVAAKEGRCAVKASDLQEFWLGQKNIVLLDPNILAYKGHMELLEELKATKAKIDFTQGLDLRLMNQENLTAIRDMNTAVIHVAYDRPQDKAIIEPKLELLAEMGYTRSKVLVFILTNYKSTLAEDLHRIQLCRKLNFAPYPMIYDKAHCNKIYRHLQRWCNNNCFWAVPTFEDYLRGIGFTEAMLKTIKWD